MHLEFEDVDEYGYARSVSLVAVSGETLWTRTPPFGNANDAWTHAEVVASSWSGFLATFDATGKEVKRVFTT
jgi:hypothetical protein